nr:hypothetical protein BAU18_05950 [Enterococcus diestrammenae]
MIIAGTLWFIFSLSLFLTSQVLTDQFVTFPQPVILVIAVLSFIVGIFFYYKYFADKKKK